MLNHNVAISVDNFICHINLQNINKTFVVHIYKERNSHFNIWWIIFECLARLIAMCWRPLGILRILRIWTMLHPTLYRSTWDIRCVMAIQWIGWTFKSSPRCTTWQCWASSRLAPIARHMLYGTSSICETKLKMINQSDYKILMLWNNIKFIVVI